MKTYLEIRPGNGGQDAYNFVTELANAIEQALLKKSKSVERTISASQSITLMTNISISSLSWLEGTHVVTRIPAKSSARHTSSATIVIRQEILLKKTYISKKDVRVDRYRSSGRGGQNVNKVETAIRLTHYPTGIVITRESGRSQHANLEDAYKDLGERLALLDEKQQHEDVNNSRSIEESRAFTHNYQRDEVISHSDGQRWNLKKFNAGKWNIIR